MRQKRLLAALLALTLALALSVSTFAAGDFTDVAEDAYYADAVDWAVEKQVTVGRGEGVFDPEATVTRREAVTFLWRMAGRPEAAQTETFSDVENDPNRSWYETAVQWAVEQGVTVGTGNGQFSPDIPCQRGMILTMLYRMEDCPFDAAARAVVPEDSETWTLEDLGNRMIQAMLEGFRGEDGFTDVPEGSYYELPIVWAMFSGILGEKQIDTEAKAVRPEAACPRGEMVYFLYRASGDAPVEGAVQVGKIPETVLLDRDGVTITATGIQSEGMVDAVLTLTVENGTEKLLRLDADGVFVNTYAHGAQVCIPKENEEGWIFYTDAVVAPGQTQDCQLRLNSLDDIAVSKLCELELRMTVSEVEAGEYGYDYVDNFAVGETLTIRTNLYDEDAVYDMEGTVLLEQDGLQLRLVKAENSENMGPEITLYGCNSGSRDLYLELAALNLDGVVYEGYFSMDLPAGKRSVNTLSPHIMDFDNVPTVSQAVFTLQTVDPETWEPETVFAPLTVTFPD